MTRMYTYEIQFDEPDDLERRLVECFERKRAKQPVIFSDVVGEDDEAIYNIEESFAGGFTGGVNSYQKELNVKNFERRLIDYLEENIIEEPEFDIDILMRDMKEGSGRVDMTTYSLKKTYVLNNGLIVTYGIQDGVLGVRVNFGNDDNSSKAFEELNSLIQSEGKIVINPTTSSSYTFIP